MRLYYLIMTTDINQSIIQRFILRHYLYGKLKYAYKGITFLRTQLTFLHVFEVFIDSDLYSKRIIYICWASKPEYILYYKVYGLLGPICKWSAANAQYGVLPLRLYVKFLLNLESKSVFLTIQAALIFEFLGIFDIFKYEIFTKIRIRGFRNC